MCSMVGTLWTLVGCPKAQLSLCRAGRHKEVSIPKTLFLNTGNNLPTAQAEELGWRISCPGKHSLLLETAALSVPAALLWEFVLVQGWAGASEPPLTKKRKQPKVSQSL